MLQSLTLHPKLRDSEVPLGGESRHHINVKKGFHAWVYLVDKCIDTTILSSKQSLPLKKNQHSVTSQDH